MIRTMLLISAVVTNCYAMEEVEKGAISNGLSAADVISGKAITTLAIALSAQALDDKSIVSAAVAAVAQVVIGQVVNSPFDIKADSMVVDNIFGYGL